MRTITTIIMALSLTSQAWCSVIEVPGVNQKMSGVYFFTGWKCVQGILSGRIDGGTPFPLAGKIERPDTEAVCSNSGNNGWIAQYNFNRLSQGTHTFEAFDGAASFAIVVFQVVHFGVEFKAGVSGSGTAILSDGSSAELVWSQALQGFPITKTFGGFSFTTLLGKWRFTSGSLLILGNDYDLQQFLALDPPGIIGEDKFGDLIVVVKVDSSFGEFFLLDEGSTLCLAFFFDQTGPDRIEGIRVSIDRVSGECVASTILSGPTDMIGFGLLDDFDISFGIAGPTEASVKALHESHKSTSPSPASPGLTLMIQEALSKISNLAIP